MNDGPFPPQRDDLGQALGELRSQVEYPPTPDLVPLVRARLPVASPRSPGVRIFIGRSRLALTTLIIALLALLAVALVPPARTAVARWFGIPGIVVTRGTLPPGPLGGHLQLGKRVTLGDARSRVGFPILVPTLPSLGQPDEVYVGSVPGSKSVTLLYHARPGLPRSGHSGAGLLLTEFRVLPLSVPIEKMACPTRKLSHLALGTIFFPAVYPGVGTVAEEVRHSTASVDRCIPPSAFRRTGVGAGVVFRLFADSSLAGVFPLTTPKSRLG